jgi:hypothetical protein
MVLLSLPFAPLLGGDLAVVLDVDVLVGGERVDLVLGERGAGLCVREMILERWEFGRRRDVREAGYELELVLDLAALVGAVLLGSGVC